MSLSIAVGAHSSFAICTHNKNNYLRTSSHNSVPTY
jgi:hypothetical protein